MEEHTQRETPKERVDALLSRNNKPNLKGICSEGACSDFYSEARGVWYAVNQDVHLEKIFSGKRVLEIGPGYDGGLSELVLGLGALSYLGVDISRAAVETSKKKIERMHTEKMQILNAEFIFDDSFYIIKSLKEPHIIISSGVFDTCIIKSRDYAEQLIRVIYEKTPENDFTIHSASGLYNDFDELFLAAGFKRILLLPSDSFGFYKKEK